MFLRLLFLLGLLLAAATRKTEATANANSKQHGVICWLTAIASAARPVKDLQQDPTEAVNEILAVNMSLSDPKWQALFNSSDETNIWEKQDTKLTGAKYATDWQESWGQWREAKKKAVADKMNLQGGTDWPSIATESDRRAASLAVRQIAARALAWKAEYDADIKIVTDETANPIKDKLTAALFGGDGKAAEITPGTSYKQGSNYAGICVGSGTRLSLAGDLACLCMGKAAETTCHEGFGGYNLDSQTDIKSQWTALRKSCKSNTPAILTTAEIKAALSAFRTALSHKDNGGESKMFLGTATDHSCDGSTSKMCVDYDEFNAKDGSKTWHDIPWVNNLEAAALGIEKQTAAAASAQAAAKQIQAALGETKVIYSAALAGELSPGNTKVPNTDNMAEEPPIKSEKPTPNVCAGKRVGTSCKDGCKEITENGEKKCVVDQTYKPKQAEEENQDGKTYCFNHTTQQACVEENKGKSRPVCGCSKNKVGEEENDIEKRRNGSFLSNKIFV
ncbi:Trypanosomal VSG domain containing protein [Trypanosoma brucei equiperdum]|uniref:Trypanosomal VSG domain containing protein n=1 Tax=Trypanosoma brucei equiperdum TaxID=630700 RepID=A0A3L6L7A9_9TRYP|nr:Trypanosomal VSG domain containing protein [Trypanosoma brucei equiperdum]RHW72125.1 Trypanosomal VSG domain containing protein [Trypanosoma brucei equiperdum]RHW72148.1 Trypanosomal VSG domain containing protein [Trypanosoma brucei equiperdum]RHW72207.1 Trypanosomal VSG domain containing protein [Trypanosoma brucei equiperdum]